MSSARTEPRFQLVYWPLPFRGCFVSYLFAYRDVPLKNEGTFETVTAVKDLAPDEQPIPFVGPPLLRDHETGQSLSQTPAIVLYVARELDLAPDDSFELAMCMKVLMDCNDVLMEVCRYNGTSMWNRVDWQQFRAQRLPRWFTIFEESLHRGYLGTDPVTFADIAVYALFGNMTRCLPELETDLERHAPAIHSLCQRIGATPSLAKAVAEDEEKFGKLYCGGQIEASIREMLEQDGAEPE